MPLPTGKISIASNIVEVYIPVLVGGETGSEKLESSIASNLDIA